MKQYFSFQWHITDECDQRCKHCYIFSEDACKHLDAMSWEQMQDTFSTVWTSAKYMSACRISILPAAIPSCTLIFGSCSG